MPRNTNVETRISIIIPSFNQGIYIEETIQSILNQSYSNYEIIIFDGGSKDITLQILEKYRSYISHLSIGKDKGQSDAIKKGFALAEGEILYWINSDDILTENALHSINNAFLKTKKPSVFFGNLDIINSNSKFLFTKYLTPIPPIFGRYSIYRGLFGFYQPSFFMTASAYRLTKGMNPDLFFCMDNDLFKKLAKERIDFIYINKSLSKFRIHENSKSSNFQDKGFKERIHIFGETDIKDRFLKIYILLFRTICYFYKLRIIKVIKSKYKIPWLP